MAALTDRLRAAGLRPTRQRLALGRLLLNGERRHVTAEQVHIEAQNSGERVSLATVYNALNQFTDAGLLREVVIDQGRSYFDTNVSDHHHFYFEADGRLVDIPEGEVRLAEIPTPPAGGRIRQVDVVVRVAPEE